MKNDEKPVANPWVVLREEFDDWAVLFDPDTGRGFGLNPTGVYLWKFLDGGHTLDSLLEEIRLCAGGLPEEAKDHVVGFVEELVAEGLARFDSTPSGLPHKPDRAALPLRKGAVSVENSLNYEPPKLIDFTGKSATGTCSCCSSGTNVGGTCDSFGACAGSNCWSGTCPSSQCLTVGNSASANRVLYGKWARSYC